MLFPVVNPIASPGLGSESSRTVIFSFSSLKTLTLQEHDLFASDVRQALIALAPLLGEIPTDEILNRIFSNCGSLKILQNVAS